MDGNTTTLDTEDITITKSYGDNWAGAADGQTVVMIDKRLTPELKNEGIARDLVRNVQKLRKEAGLDIADRITLSLVTDSAALKAAIDQCGDYIQAETLATTLTSEALADALASTDVKIDGATATVSLSRNP